MKKYIFKRPFQCSLQTTPFDLISSKVITFDNAKPSIEQVVKENIQLLQKDEDLPEEKILYEAPSELINSDNDEPPPPIPCQNLIKKLRKDKTPSNLIKFDKNEQIVRASNSTKETSFVSDDDLNKMIRLVKRMKKLKV